MSFGIIPDYSDRAVFKNPYILFGVGLVTGGAFLNWWGRRKVAVDQSLFDPSAAAGSGENAPLLVAGAVGLKDTALTPAQQTAFISAIPAHGRKYAPLLLASAAKHNVSPVLLAAIMSTETGYGAACKDAACRGFAGGDYGVMQINKIHKEFFATKVNGRPAYEDPASSIDYGATVLKRDIATLTRRTDEKGSDLLFAAAAAYNTGAGNVLKSLKKGKSADATTHGGKYAKTVFKEVERILGEMNAPQGPSMVAAR